MTETRFPPRVGLATQDLAFLEGCGRGKLDLGTSLEETLCNTYMSQHHIRAIKENGTYLYGERETSCMHARRRYSCRDNMLMGPPRQGAGAQLEQSGTAQTHGILISSLDIGEMGV